MFSRSDSKATLSAAANATYVRLVCGCGTKFSREPPCIVDDKLQKWMCSYALDKTHKKKHNDCVVYLCVSKLNSDIAIAHGRHEVTKIEIAL